MLIFDAHLDLSMNALEWNRDLTRGIDEIRARERGKTDKPDRGNGTVSLAEMRKGSVGLCVATLIARYVKPANPLPGFHSPEIAWAQTQGQLAWYRAMEEAGQMVPDPRPAQRSNAHARLWQESAGRRADRLHPEPGGSRLDSHARPSRAGLRARPARDRARPITARAPMRKARTSPADWVHAAASCWPRWSDWASSSTPRICATTVFGKRSITFTGHVWASHNNCRALVDDTRQFTDEQLKALIARGAVIGGALDAWMMVPGWIRGKTTPHEAGVTLEHLVDHIDHVCQLAGNARHSGIGTDLDGGFGREQCPTDLATIADLARVPRLLAKRGYAAADVEAIMHGNWIRFLKRAWG